MKARKLAASITVLAVLSALTALLLWREAGFPALGQETTEVGSLVINEIMYNPDQVTDTLGEWFEIRNISDTAIDIEGWTIRELSGSGNANNHVIDNGGPLVVSARGFLVLGKNADTATNGGIALDYAYGSQSLNNNGGDTLTLLDNEGTVWDQVAYDDGPNFPNTAGRSMSLDPASATTTDNDDGTNWCEATTAIPGSSDFGTPGAANPSCGTPPPTTTPPTTDPPPETLISAIQGTGDSVAITDPVQVTAIVTSLFTSRDVLDGFFIQEEDADSDNDPATSEGIFVFCRGSCPPSLAVGNQVTITGTPTENFDMSQIDVRTGSIAINPSTNPLPTATDISLPASASTSAEATFENLEGMVVNFPDELFISEYFALARFGQVVLTVDGRPYQFTHNNPPDVTGYANHLADLATRRIILDDDNNDQNDPVSNLADEPYPYPTPGLSNTNFFRGGDSIQNMVGVLHWSWGGNAASPVAWRVRPIQGQEPAFTSNNPRPVTPDPVGGTLRVASFNVLNFFTTLDTGGTPCGPQGGLECRGANSADELTRQRDKIVAALTAIDADVVGVVEVENHPEDAALIHLVEGLNADTAPGTYDHVRTGTIGGDAIKVGLLYQPATVTPVGQFRILDSSVDPNFIDTKNRPVLIQSFREIANGEIFTVAVAHLKSKGSSCDDVGDPDGNDGQANCAGTRTMAATALIEFLASNPTGISDPDVIITGDLNAYAQEEAITTLEAAGYTNLIDHFLGSDTYSFLFDGQRGYLDHALASSTLMPHVTGVTEWHINADEIPLFDYNDDMRDPGETSFQRESDAETIYEANAFRSSDHDPVIVGLDLSPLTLQATPGNQRVFLSWDIPDRQGLSGFVYLWCQAVEGESACDPDDTGTSMSAELSASTNTGTATGLENGVEYRFDLMASYNDGSSQRATTVATPIDLPGPSVTTVGRANNPPQYSACIGPASLSAGFEDTVGSFAEEAINCLSYYGVTKGRTATLYDPANTITRWEAALFLARAAGPAGVELSNDDQGFTDIAGFADEEIRVAANAVAATGIMPGITDDLFGPNEQVTRELMALILDAFWARAEIGVGGTEPGSVVPDDTFEDIEEVSVGAYDAIRRLYELGIIFGTSDTTFTPDRLVSRAQMAVAFSRLLGHTRTKPAGITMQVGDPVVVGSSVELLVSVRDDQFQPVVDAPINLFDYDLDQAADAFEETGVCADRIVRPVIGLGSVACRIGLNNQLTDTFGDITFDFTVPRDVIVTAWTGEVGDIFNSDETTMQASVTLGSRKPADRLIVSDNLNENQQKIRFGQPVMFILQVADEDSNPVALPGQSVNVRVREVTADGTVSTATRIHRTDASGQILFSRTLSDVDSEDGDDGTVTFTFRSSQYRIVYETRNPCSGSTCRLVWSDDPAQPTSLTLTSRSQYTLASDEGRGASNRVQVTLTDQYGDPVRGEQILFITSDPTILQAREDAEVSRTTDRRGQVGFTYYRDSADSAQETIIAEHRAEGSSEASHMASLTFYWAERLGDGSAVNGALLRVADTNNNAVVLEDGTQVVLAEYDTNDQFNNQADEAIRFGDFEQSLGGALGNPISVSNYSRDAGGVSVFTLDGTS